MGLRRFIRLSPPKSDQLQAFTGDTAHELLRCSYSNNRYGIEYLAPPPHEKKPDEEAHPEALLAEKLLQGMNDGQISDPATAEIQQLLAFS
jgi:hypothetical protein